MSKEIRLDHTGMEDPAFIEVHRRYADGVADARICVRVDNPGDRPAMPPVEVQIPRQSAWDVIWAICSVGGIGIPDLENLTGQRNGNG